MAPVETDPRAVAAHVRALRKAGQPFLVGVDGTTGAGKTRLAHCLACLSEFGVIDTDQFVAKPSVPYIDHLDHQRIAAVLARYEAAAKPVLLAGVEVLAFTSRLRVEVGALVYVMRLNQHGYWLDADECDHRGDAGWKLRRNVSSIPSPLAREIAQYHLDYRPLETANVIYTWRTP